MTNTVTIEEIDITHDVVALENITLHELERALYAMVEETKKRKSSNEGDTTFAA
jgi:hypothetical protein